MFILLTIVKIMFLFLSWIFLQYNEEAWRFRAVLKTTWEILGEILGIEILGELI